MNTNLQPTPSSEQLKSVEAPSNTSTPAKVKGGSKSSRKMEKSTRFKYANSINPSRPLFENCGKLAQQLKKDYPAYYYTFDTALWDALVIIAPEMAKLISGGPYDPRKGYEHFERFRQYLWEIQDESENR